MEEWTNQSRKGPMFRQLSVKDCPLELGMTELHCPGLSGFEHFGGHLANHCGHANDQNNPVFCPDAFDH
jgi:hypothetical protein